MEKVKTIRKTEEGFTSLVNNFSNSRRQSRSNLTLRPCAARSWVSARRARGRTRSWTRLTSEVEVAEANSWPVWKKRFHFYATALQTSPLSSINSLTVGFSIFLASSYKNKTAIKHQLIERSFNIKLKCDYVVRK